MLIQEASKWDIATYVLDEDDSGPASSIATCFFHGNRLDYQTVYEFGKKVDLLTFEIESINIEALQRLKEEGLEIVPDPSILMIFQDKEKQKDFYLHHDLPTAAHRAYNAKEDILKDLSLSKQNSDEASHKMLSFPFVQKLKKGGYDGRGIAVINNEDDLPNLLDGESIIEEKIEIYKEIAVIVARNKNGEVVSFPAVEMVFNQKANLVERLVCPAIISNNLHKQAADLANKLITSLNMQGILAIEFFIEKGKQKSNLKRAECEGRLLINESAPRPHNSGHHTIESIMTSQYEQHLRAILNLPLGSTAIKMPSIMLNLLGEPGCHGNVQYHGLKEALSIEGVKVHLYGKKITKPFRKMGHVTIIDPNIKNAIKKADLVENILRVKV